MKQSTDEAVRNWLLVTGFLIARVVAAGEGRISNGPCATAIAESAVCEAANERAIELFKRDHLVGTLVIQNVQTGSLVAFAASDPARLDVNTSVLPLSTVKLMLAASWWDHGQPDVFSPAGTSVSEMIVTGDDNAGRRIASLLRKEIGTTAMMKDLDRYGFVAKASAGAAAKEFWAELPAQWKNRLTPAVVYHWLDERTPTKDWEDTLSLGEARFTTTALSLSRFLQSVENGGVMLQPTARSQGATEASAQVSSAKPVRVMEESTARKLQDALRIVVERGTARSASDVLKGSGWQIGGKTGTGPGPNPPGPQSDGWFAGLIFDRQGIARFTVATFVRSGGLGGGHAARISAELARFVSGASDLGDVAEKFAQVERRSGGQIGVAAIEPDRNKQILYRADERFPMCSTFKVLAVSALLKRVDEGKEKLDRVIHYGETDLLPNSPITSVHIKEGGMQLSDVCAAAIEQSDNTAGNLILSIIGGPAGLTEFARSLGDSVTKLERTEIELNYAVPGDVRDTTAASAMCRNLQKLFATDMLTAASRNHLEDWLNRNTTGTAMIRSAAPADWRVGDKTGRNSAGAANDVAVLHPPTGGPLFLAIYTFAPKLNSDQRDKLVAEIAQIAINDLNNRE